MKLGCSATPQAFDGLSFVDAYAKEVQAQRVKGCYFYGQSAPVWGSVAGIPSDHAIAFQTKGATRSSFDTTLKTFPAARPASVFLHPINEIDRQVHTGVLTLAQAQQRIDDVVAAVAASGRSAYVLPAVGIQYWCLINYLRGTLGSRQEWDWPAYIRPGVKRLLVSVYASGHVKNGHVAATADEDPAAMAANLDAQLDKHPGVSWTAVLGFPVPSGYIGDATSLQNRADWLQRSFDTYRAMRHPASHLLWFDRDWPALGDERLAEAKLHQKWVALAAEVGQ